MVRQELWYEIHSRYRLKEPKKSIARALGLSVQTVRKILKQDKPKPYIRTRKREGILSPFEDYIRQRLPAVGYCAQAIYEEVVDRGYEGSYDTVKRFVRPLRKKAHTEATVRFETPPGKQGQVDWGQQWTVIARKRSRVHLFAMTLGYSRRIFAEGTYEERLPVFLRCHEKAFDHFCGVPHEIIYDNPKTVVLSRDFEGRRINWNPTFWDFATYYGFRPWPHRPYRARTKGKVESGIRYVKRFLRGKSFSSLEHLNECLINWTVNVADQRIHGTTHRKPAEMFEEEKELLIPHKGKPPFKVQQRAVRHVARDCMVSFESNRYSVPARFVGQEVEVQAWGSEVLIFYDGTLIATHPRCEGKYHAQINKEHYNWISYQEDPHVTGLVSANSGPPLDQEVEVRDLGFYEALVEQGGAL